MIPFSQLLLQAQALSANVAGKTAVFWSGDKDGTPLIRILQRNALGCIHKWRRDHRARPH